MNKNEVIKEMSKRLNKSKVQVEEVVDTLFHIIMEKVKGGRSVTFSGFGTFRSTPHKERKGHNPQDGKSIIVPRIVLPKFKAGRKFKSELNS